MNINISLSTSSIETVTKNLITKLYDLAFNAEGGDIISYLGNIYSATAYANEVKYLQDNFPNLVINVPESGQYVKFESGITESILANKIGDGIGVPILTANTLTSLPANLYEIDRFEELKNFTNVHTIPVNVFGTRFGNNTLVSIDLKNITIVGDVDQSGSTNAGAFLCCKSLLYLGDISNITHIGTYTFSNCTAFDLSKWYIFNSVLQLGLNINQNSSMRKIVFGENLNKLLLDTFHQNTKCTVVILATTPPTLNGTMYTGGNLWNFTHKVKFYVPDEAWSDYILDEGWNKLVSTDYLGDNPSNLFKISLLPDEDKIALRNEGLNI